MDNKMFFKMFTVIMFLFPISTALRILVTKDQCGRSIDLTVEKVLYLDYEGADVGDILSKCVITVTNNDTRDMICIRSEGESYIDVDCAMHLRYHIGAVKRYSYKKEYFCSDFYLKPLCDRNSVSSVEYRFVYQRNASVHVKLFTKKHIVTTTSRYTPSTWSSWMSWSSDYNDYDDDDSSAGTVVQVLVGIFIIFAILISCVCAKFKAHGRSSTPKPQYGAPVVVQYHFHAQHGNQLANQTQNSPNQATSLMQYPPNQPGIQPQQQYTPDPSVYAGYQVQKPVYQQVPMVGNQPALTPQAYDPPDSDPPPPYPGY
ncbi:uncharacterized protein LOC123529540 [Mercenaria mercenaria]|uniref:uncharacterized protein LOC123529540 n=1 Tax=Mercenaria mercenaria TaxID=6596 RepID=UPI00234F9B19|nr:uncharacterized protein LOC123529540 [Mercenaria mercenaria]